MAVPTLPVAGPTGAAPPRRPKPRNQYGVQRDGVTYPDRDGRPLAETQAHLDQIIYLLVALQQYFAAVPDVFVAADLLLYYVHGDPRQRVAPDAFVARGVDDAKRLRRTYLLWEEGAPPEVVFEITSASSRREDTETKRALYERLGVREYFLFDPLGDYLRPPLQGFRLSDGSYQPLAPAPDGTLRSEALGLELRLHGRWLRLYDPRRDAWLQSPDDLAAAREAEATARRQAEERAAAAESELARLRALLEDRSGR